MAIDDIQDLHKQSDALRKQSGKELFEQGPLPLECNYYRRIPIPRPESTEPHDLEKALDLASWEQGILKYDQAKAVPTFDDAPLRTSFPGAPSRHRCDVGSPSPDELAFYSPFAVQKVQKRNFRGA